MIKRNKNEKETEQEEQEQEHDHWWRRFDRMFKWHELQARTEKMDKIQFVDKLISNPEV